MRKLDSIIFDLDGTLWDTCNSCAIGWNNVIRKNHIPFRTIRADDVGRVTGKPHEECIRTVFSGLSEPQLKILIHETAEEDNRIVSELGGVLYPGVKTGLARLRQYGPLFIVSNCQSGYIEAFLKWSDFGSLFQDFECWGNTGRTKAENIQSVIDRNNLTSPVYIGDTEGDRVAARQCGLPFMHVTYGFGTCSEADRSLGSFEDLVRELEGFNIRDQNLAKSFDGGAANPLEHLYGVEDSRRN